MANTPISPLAPQDEAILDEAIELGYPKIILDLYRKYGYVPAHKPDGLPKKAFQPLVKIPVELLESKTVTIIQKVDKSGENATFVAHIVCEEGDQEVPLDSVIGYGCSDKTTTGYNCWRIDNYLESLRRTENGDFVTVKKGLVLFPVSPTLPKVLEGFDIQPEGTNAWSYPYQWSENGRQTATIGQGFWVIDGQEATGKPTFHFLGSGSAGCEQTILCHMNGDDYGEDICTLSELYPNSIG